MISEYTKTQIHNEYIIQKRNNPQIMLPSPDCSMAAEYYKNFLAYPDKRLESLTIPHGQLKELPIASHIMFKIILNCSGLTERNFYKDYWFDSKRLPDSDFLHRFKADYCPNNCRISLMIREANMTPLVAQMPINETMIAQFRPKSLKAQLSVKDELAIEKIVRESNLDDFIYNRIPATLSRIQKVWINIDTDSQNRIKRGIFNPEYSIRILENAMIMKQNGFGNDQIMENLCKFPQDTGPIPQVLAANRPVQEQINQQANFEAPNIEIPVPGPMPHGDNVRDLRIPQQHTHENLRHFNDPIELSTQHAEQSQGNQVIRNNIAETFHSQTLNQEIEQSAPVTPQHGLRNLTMEHPQDPRNTSSEYTNFLGGFQQNQSLFMQGSGGSFGQGPNGFS